MIGHPERVALLALIGLIFDALGLLALIVRAWAQRNELESINSEEKQSDATE